MMELGRIVGLDVGEVRTGVAASDPLQIIASPRTVVDATAKDQGLAEIKGLLDEYEAILIVVGLPLDMAGKVGPQAERVLAFVERLRAVVDLDIEMQDERYSTAAAERMLVAANVRRKKRKQVRDKIAATHILQTYLDRRAAEKKRGL